PAVAEKKKTKTAGDGANWGELIQQILTAEAYHDPLVRLAAKLIKSSMYAGAAVNMLRGLMESAKGDHAEDRWKARYDDIPRAVETAREKYEQKEKPPSEPVANCSLDEVHAVFRKWLGADYDLDAIDATIATAASERLSGDPLWLLVV